MFEQLEARAARVAEGAVAERIAVLAGQLREILPREVSVEPTDEGVLLSGRGLGKRIVLDAGLRWTIAGLLK